MSRNPLPTWWLWTLYLAMAFGVVYWLAYRELGAAALPMQAYQEELAEQQGGADVGGEALLALAEDPRAVSEGKETFMTHCIACHGAEGEGQIGPNLTDDHWIHGGSAESIHETIAQGIQAKGMPAWGPTLGAVKVQQVSAYVLTLRGTNVSGKPPEGEAWQPEAEAQQGAEPEAGAADEPKETEEPEAAEDAAESEQDEADPVTAEEGIPADTS